MPNWLPPLITLQQFGGSWEDFFQAVYEQFEHDFLGQRPAFQGKRMGLKKHPLELGKPATFWHFISNGPIEADRLLDLRRCERIGWPRAIIDNCVDPAVRMWSEDRKGSSNIHLWCEEAEFLVVLADRGDFVLPWTAYPVERRHEQEKLKRRWAQFH